MYIDIFYKWLANITEFCFWYESYAGWWGCPPKNAKTARDHTCQGLYKPISVIKLNFTISLLACRQSAVSAGGEQAWACSFVQVTIATTADSE